MMDDNTTQQLIRLPNPDSSDGEYHSWREGFILTTLRIACVGGVAMILGSFLTTEINVRILFISLYVILLAVTFLPLGYNIRAFTFLAIVYAIGLNALIGWGPLLDGSLFLLTVVIFSGLLFDARIDLVSFIITSLTMATLWILGQVGVFRPTSPTAPIPTSQDWQVYIIGFMSAGVSLLIAMNMFKTEISKLTRQTQESITLLNQERHQVKARLREQQELLEKKNFQSNSSSIVARSVTQFDNVTDLIENMVITIANQYGYHHVGIYLLDDQKKIAYLQASSSATGKDMIGQGLQIEVGARNPINLVVEQNHFYKASDSGGGFFIKDENFPSTRSRFTLPLIARGTILGILDLHSIFPDTFDTQDIESMQTLADLIALTMDNNRLVNETTVLIQQLELFTTTQTRETWARHNARKIPSYQYTPAGVRPIFSATMEDESAPGSLFVPLTLQGETIGKIKLQRKTLSGNWSEREREMVSKVAEQISLALENSRLVEDAQRNAQRDQLIANVSTRIRETLDMETVIRTAATEFRKVFDLKEAEITVGLPQSQPKPIRRHTSSLRLK